MLVSISQQATGNQTATLPSQRERSAHVCHRVASVNFYDGPTQDAAKVEASQEYKDLIVRLSSAPKPSPHFTKNWPQRWINKQLGWPSTEDVGILSGLIIALKNATEAKLGIKLDKIVLAHPRFPALTAEDIGDAIEHAGLQSWLHLATHGPGSELDPPIQLGENRAALAAHGIRTCQEYGSWHVCIEGMSYEYGRGLTYFASLSNSALYTSLDYYLQPFEYVRDYKPDLFDINIGLDSMAQYSSNESYWASVRDKLVPQNVSRPISHVVIGGEAGLMPEFQKALREALASVPLAKGALDSMTGNATAELVDPMYAAARGAALLARWRQEAPSGCFETRDCDERRAHERAGIPYIEQPKPSLTWRRLSSYELDDESEL